MRYNTQQSPPPVSILSRLIQSMPPTHFFKIHFNIVFPFSKWAFSLRFRPQNPLCTSHLLHTCHMLLPPHSSWFDNPSIWWQAQIMGLHICSLLHSHVTSSPLGPNIPLSTLFSNNLSLLCSSLSVTDHVSHPHQTTGKIIVPYICTWYIYIYFLIASRTTEDTPLRIVVGIYIYIYIYIYIRIYTSFYFG